jgi:hypothetical protein
MYLLCARVEHDKAESNYNPGKKFVELEFSYFALSPYTMLVLG